MRSRIFLFLLVLGFALRLGYGVARYRGAILGASGTSFIQLWDYDGLEHVLIAVGVVRGDGYVMPELPGLQGKHIRETGVLATFKAPLYEFFLSAVFALSGISFWLFFPLQALFGGILSGLMAELAYGAFGRAGPAWIAGLAAAVHPVLINTASQPYNENLYFLLFFSTLWAFGRWLEDARARWLIAVGILAALTALTRESAIPL
jgi:4-amino-4-deoxy-L-arabinose transferase-like glycosyltransferase